MAELKNQHFVPKVHLKNFSDDPGSERRMINMINVGRERPIRGASISGQCSKSYFYGQDLRLEKAIGGLEGSYGEVIRKIEAGDTTTATVELLKPWVQFQHLRTDSARKRLRSFHDEMNMAIEDQRFQWDVTDAELVNDAIKIFFASNHLLDDLRVVIIRNVSKSDFITSDAPAVVFSKWLHQTKGIDSYGLFSSGLCFYMPLSPRTAFLCFDGNVYNVEAIKNNVITIGSRDEIDNLNSLLLRADAQNIYFQDWADRDRLLGQVIKQKPFRTSGTRTKLLVPVEGNSSTFRELASGENAKNFSRNIIASESVFPHPERWFGFLRNKIRPRFWFNGTAVGHVRKEEWLRASQDEMPPQRPANVLPGLPGNPLC